MGNLYTNIVLKGPGQAKVCKLLGHLGRGACVAPTVNGYTVVCDRACEDQDKATQYKVSKTLSRSLKCTAITFLNHDDDVLWYCLYDAGKRIDEYDSNPEFGDFIFFHLLNLRPRTRPPGPPSGGDASKMCKAFDVLDSTDVVESVLRRPGGRDGYLTAYLRHKDLATALRLPACTVGFGYTSLNKTEQPEWFFRAGELDPAQLIWVGR
jgi:hypothetical protein